MALTPAINGIAVTFGAEPEAGAGELQTSRTYKVDFASGRVAGMTDGTDALEQAIYKILQTERFAHLIYSWAYGFEGNRIIGQGEAVLRGDIDRLLSEALTEDDRIETVENVKIEIIGKRTAAVDFTVVSVFGDFETRAEVTY